LDAVAASPALELSAANALRLEAHQMIYGLEIGRYALALEQSERVLTALSDFKNRRHVCEVRLVRAELYWRDGQRALALREAHTALDIAREVNRQTSEAMALCLIARYRTAFGDRSQAREHADLLRAKRFQERDDPRCQAEIALTLCTVHIGLGEFDAAVPLGNEAVEINAAMPRPLHQARCMTALAEAHTGRQAHDTARQLHQQALEIFTSLGVPEAERLRKVITARPANKAAKA
ncbi:MAG: tetratricopeptide repeat protein, partial [Stackebrandtia sp.]